MKLTGFRVSMFKSVVDSGWIDLEQLTVIVGKNESGKTTLLKALHKFNAFQGKDSFNIKKDWPRGQRREKDANTEVCACRFVLSPEEINSLFGVRSSTEIPIEIGKNYHNKFVVRVSDAFLDALYPEDSRNGEEASPTEGETDTAEVSEDDGVDAAATIASKVPGILPTFIYMDDYRVFEGTAELNQLQQRKTEKKLTPQDETVLMLFKLSGLTLEEEVKKIAQGDKEERQYDLADASATLTRDIANRLKSRQYQVEYRADGASFFTFVKDDRDPSLIELKERSKGFQWFFSFDLLFMHESQGQFANCIVLLDEPGLHLHPEAQRDLLVRLEAYAEGNVLIYTTHLPFMLDLKRPERIRVLSESTDGVKVSMDLTESQPEGKFVLQAALGMSGSSSHLVSQRNLVVEGVDDYWLVSELSRLMERSEKSGLPDDVLVTPAGGASEGVYIATFMIGQNLEVVALFDSDQAGRTAKDKLLKNWLTRFKGRHADAALLGESAKCESVPDFAIEDLLGNDLYVKAVKETYKKELAVASIALDGFRPGGVAKQIEKVFEGANLKFNKGSVAKRLRSDLSKMASVDKLPVPVKDAVVNLFADINEKFASFLPQAAEGAAPPKQTAAKVRKEKK